MLVKKGKRGGNERMEGGQSRVMLEGGLRRKGLRGEVNFCKRERE